jgi:multiple sugar transport system permease protein
MVSLSPGRPVRLRRESRLTPWLFLLVPLALLALLTYVPLANVG